MENKSEGNKKNIILVDPICTMDKWTGVGEIKFKDFIDALPMVDNGLMDLWRRENPDCSEFAHRDRSSGRRSRKDKVYTDIKIATNTKINQTMVSFTDHYNDIYLDRLPSKSKIGKY